MRVSTLIAELSKLDPDAQVYVQEGGSERSYEVAGLEEDEDGDVVLYT